VTPSAPQQTVFLYWSRALVKCPVAKLLIEKGVITQDEFMEKIKAERATYQAMFQKVIH